MSCNSIPNSELLSRFIVYKRWLREGRVKQDAFFPPRDLKLSVTRHLNLSEEDIWRYGELATGTPPRKLHGRTDVKVGDVKREKLHVAIAPVSNNPNHANIINWPQDKHAQKMKAILLAVEAQFVAAP